MDPADRDRDDDFDVELAALARQAKALSHPARLAILRFLADQDRCICADVVAELPLAQATVSQHLKVLRDAGLIRVTPDGRASSYCLDPDALDSFHRRITTYFTSLEGAPRQPAC